MNDKVGYQIVTTATSIQNDGVPVAVYGVNMAHAGSSTSLYNGFVGSGTDVEVVIATSTIAGETINFPYGIVFPNGCFVDNNDGSCTVLYKAII